MKREQKNAMIVLGAAVGLVMMGGMARTASANLLTNGGFETQGSGDATTAAGWTFNPEGAVQPLSIARDTNSPESGSYDLHMTVSGSVAGGADVANVTSTFDPTAPATVTPGTTYTLTFDTTGAFGPGSVLNTFMDFYDANGAFISRDILQGGYATASTGYLSHTLTDTAPTNAAYFDVYFNFVTGAFDGASGDMSIDNVSVTGPGGTSTPEPASLSVLGLGIAALVSRRRR